MRFLKWAVLIALVLIVVVTALYLRRDAVARELANTLLSDSELEVIDVTVQSLGTERLEFSTLVVESLSGNRYEVSGLSVPVSVDDDELSLISADTVVVIQSVVDRVLPALSPSMQTVFELPGELGDYEVRIASVVVPNVPELLDVVWTTTGDNQELAFDVDSIRVDAHVVSIDGTHQIAVASSDNVLRALLSAELRDDSYHLDGIASIKTSAWLPTLRSLNLLPDGLAELDTELRGPVDVSIDEGYPGWIEFSSTLEPQRESTAVYAPDEQTTIRISTPTMSPLTASFNYPTMEWTVEADNAESTVDFDGSRVPLGLSSINCRSGIHCTMTATIDGENLEWSDYYVDHAIVSTTLTVEISDTTSVTFPSQNSIELTGLRIGELEAAAARVTAFSGTELVVGESNWSSSIANLELIVEDFTVAEQLLASGPISFADLEIMDSGDSVDTKVAMQTGSNGTLDGMLVSLPGFEGAVSLRDERMTSSLQLIDGTDALSADIELVRDLRSGAGAISVQNGHISFSNSRLSDFTAGWPHDWDIIGGTVGVDLSLDWYSSDAGTTYSGTMSSDFESLTATYDDYAVIGLDANVAATMDSSAGIEIAPMSVSARLIDVGLPIENVTADVTVDAVDTAVDVDNLSLETLGGRITADPFRYTAGAESNELMLHAHSIQLELMVGLADFDDVDASGTISGELPVTLHANTVTIAGGRFESEAPGGVVRYGGADSTAPLPEPDDYLGIATRALSNFEFETLTSDVEYTEEGDMKLQMTLRGINPDLDPTQPIILNLGVDNNIPQMLKSLRAIRSIEDILQEQTAR